jgi:hypothetical protein
MNGYGRAAKADGQTIDELDKIINRYKWVLLILNGISFFVAIGAFSVCVWIRFDLDFWEWVVEIDWYTYWYAIYLIMVTLCLVIANSIVGLFGTVQERTGLLMFNMVSLGLLFFLQLAGAITICVYGVEESPVLVNELHEVFIKLVYLWDVDPRASRILRQIQEYVGCCGADGSDDFINAFKPVPYECRDLITGNEYNFGCQQQFAWWLEPWTACLAGIMVVYLVADVFGIWATRKLRLAIVEYHRQDSGF